MKEIFIIAGPNGSGKSTFAKEYIKKLNLDFVNADIIAESLNPNNIYAVRLQAGKKFFQEIEAKIQNNKSFILESTLSGRYLEKLIDEFKQNKYLVTIIFVYLPSIEESLERIKNRVQKGGHNIPEEDVIRRFPRSIKNFWNKYRLKADKWEIIYNGKSEPILIAIGNSNNNTIINEDFFNKFKEIVNE